MSQYVFASNNPGKVLDLKAIFRDEGLDLLSLHDLGLDISPDETGSTFEENSLIKATEIAKFLRDSGKDYVVLADDSGLVIDVMDGLPGVDSALFMGADTSYDVRNSHILETLKDAPEDKRTARFVCVITCVFPSGEVLTTRGELEGIIAHAAKGANGFGYDPIVYVPAYSKTVAELTHEEKNKISHRGQALRAMLRKLKER